MKLTKRQFRKWQNKAITLFGISGVGKTHLANKLPKEKWFHYSADYRIGTRYLSEPILDNIKIQAMQIPFLRELLRSDSIYISNNITIDNLQPISTFMGKPGNPEKNGLTLKEFKFRKDKYHSAEISAMLDVPDFIFKSKQIYGINNFINDTGRNFCDIDNSKVLNTLDFHTLILNIKTTEEDEERLIQRGLSTKKPLYYRDEFLDNQLSIYMKERGFEYIAQIDPDGFINWIIKELYNSRIPRYQAIADQFGYTITTTELNDVNTESDFLLLIEDKLTN